jgi:hypothetical protein
MVNWQTNHRIKLEQKQIFINHKRKTADDEPKYDVKIEALLFSKSCYGMKVHFSADRLTV